MPKLYKKLLQIKNIKMSPKFKNGQKIKTSNL